MMAYLYYHDRTSVVYNVQQLKGVRPLAIRAFRATYREEAEIMAYHGHMGHCVYINFEGYPDEQETRRLQTRGRFGVKQTEFTPNDALAFAANILNSEFTPRKGFIPEGAVVSTAMIRDASITTAKSVFEQRPQKTSAIILEELKAAVAKLSTADHAELSRHMAEAVPRPAVRLNEPFVIFDEMTDYKPADWAAIQGLKPRLLGGSMSFFSNGHSNLLDQWYKEGLQNMDAKTFREQYECTWDNLPEPTGEEVAKEYAKCQAEYKRRGRTSASRNPRSKPWERI